MLDTRSLLIYTVLNATSSQRGRDWAWGISANWTQAPNTTSRLPRLTNRIRGTSLSGYLGGLDPLYLQTDEGGLICLHIDSHLWSQSPRDWLAPGQRLCLCIDAAEVKLTSPQAVLLPNQWARRVVLVESRTGELVVTVKIRGQQLTLASVGTVPREERSLSAWDPVTLTIAPEVLRLTALGTGARLRPRLLRPCSG